MTTKRKMLVLYVSLSVLGMVVALLLPLFARTSNCGGNSYALSACKQISFHVQAIVTNNNFLTDFLQINPVDRNNLFRLSDSHWTLGASYWVRTNSFGETTQRQIVVFCDNIYDNVPQPTLWNFYHRNPAHAVGFSDGTAGLISPSEFAQIDRNSFLDLTALAKIGQP